jgi:hypothetical protein
MMSCGMASLLTKVIRMPTDVCTSAGLTPFAVIVTTLCGVGGGGAGAGAGAG